MKSIVFKKLKKENGITMIALAVTLAVMLVLIGTYSFNMDKFIEQRAKTKFDTDIKQLKEYIDYYYSKNKQIPIANRYINNDALNAIETAGQKSDNDDSNYYIIDLNLIEDIDLHYGKELYDIEDEEEDISNLTDVYIINEQSHMIYLFAIGICLFLL